MAYSVLIIDDDKELRTIYRIILEREDYTVYEATNGAEALKFLVNQTPDVILIDMLMPMLGGEAVLQRIQQMPALTDTRIVVLTAYPRFRESALYFQADKFLVKPIKPVDLVEAVASVLPNKQQSEQPQ
ncbi:MAG: response regulator [Anaerolineae bacterium]|jgi:two-component system alkaline phosphatase synthesis response regulator PhoP|nr:response regulator [Anaerolineae bacterium]